MPSMTLSGAFDTSELPRLAPEPITVTVSRRVVPGREDEFTALAGELITVVSGFDGCLGAGLLNSVHLRRSHILITSI